MSKGVAKRKAYEEAEEQENDFDKRKRISNVTNLTQIGDQRINQKAKVLFIYMI
jgi:hypothetical protein